MCSKIIRSIWDDFYIKQKNFNRFELYPKWDYFFRCTISFRQQSGSVFPVCFFSSIFFNTLMEWIQRFFVSMWIIGTGRNLNCIKLIRWIYREYLRRYIYQQPWNSVVNTFKISNWFPFGFYERNNKANKRYSLEQT